MGISDRIEAFILELMRQEEEKTVRIQRNELAQLFGCVPSQINYVISTRFNQDSGYVVESRRGGGGYVTIRRMPCVDVFDIEALNVESAERIIEQLADKKLAAAMKAAVSNKALSRAENPDVVRADILKSMLEAMI